MWLTSQNGWGITAAAAATAATAAAACASGTSARLLPQKYSEAHSPTFAFAVAVAVAVALTSLADRVAGGLRAAWMSETDTGSSWHIDYIG